MRAHESHGVALGDDAGRNADSFGSGETCGASLARQHRDGLLVLPCGTDEFDIFGQGICCDEPRSEGRFDVGADRGVATSI